MNVTTQIKAQAIGVLVQKITGEQPKIIDRGTSAYIDFTPAQQIKLREYLRNQLKPRPAGDVQINAAPILIPVFLEKAAPYILAIAAAGFLAGRLTK